MISDFMNATVKLMYEESINLLKQQDIEFEKGLTLDELTLIEEIYKIQFPKSLREFLMIALPISKGFYNWRNIMQNNIDFIMQMIMRPIKDIDNMAEEVYWCDGWGDEPENELIIAKEVRKRLNKAPKILPIYAHRYMPMLLNDNPPIVYIHGIDIIYYGESLEDYLKIEFDKKRQEEIDFKNIKYIPFWSDIM